MWRKGNPPTLLGGEGDVNWCSHYGKQYGGSLKNQEQGIPWQSSGQDSALSLPEPSSILGQGTQIPRASKCSQKQQQKLKIELPHDPAIPLLGIHPEKTIIQKVTCTPMFIAALFTIDKTWKQPKCPSTNEWIKKMWYIYTTEYQS